MRYHHPCGPRYHHLRGRLDYSLPTVNTLACSSLLSAPQTSNIEVSQSVEPPLLLRVSCCPSLWNISTLGFIFYKRYPRYQNTDPSIPNVHFTRSWIRYQPKGINSIYPRIKGCPVVVVPFQIHKWLSSKQGQAVAIKGESVYHLRGILVLLCIIECVASGVSMGKESATILSFELYFADIVPYLMMMCLYSFFLYISGSNCNFKWSCNF